MQSRARHHIQSSIVLGIQLTEAEYERLWLGVGGALGSARTCVNEIQTISVKLHSDFTAGVAGCVPKILSDFCRQQYGGLTLHLTGSDYGPFEQRDQPFRVDRTFYHLGFELVTASVEMEYPGYSPFRSTRKLDVGFFRDYFDVAVEFLPDYLWWELNGRGPLMCDALDLDSLIVARRAVDEAGFDLGSFGLYLTSFEMLRLNATD